MPVNKRRVSAVFLLLIVLGIVLAGRYVSRPLFNDSQVSPPLRAFDILPPSEALTFARTVDGRVLVVVGSDGYSVSAIDMGEAFGPVGGSPLDALRVLGYDNIVSAFGAEHVSVPIASLGLPFDAAYPHVAAGTNFKDHADEVGLDGGPFLFPKLSRATPWNATVPSRTRLDYEAELCAVALEAVIPGSPAKLGFVLCNDFTDRWALLREIKLGDPMGRTGFADAKGGEGMLPIGPFLVIPRNSPNFHRQVTLGLSLNGVLRQQDSAGLMIWTPQDVARQALASCNDKFFSLAGDHRLTACDSIPAGTLMLTGTPAGVMFHYLNIWRSASYLQPGDEVFTWGDHLGVIRNRIL